MRRWLSLLALASLSACRAQPSQVMVIVDAEPIVRQRALGLHVEIFGGERGVDIPNDRIHVRDLPMNAYAWPFRFALAPENGDPERLYRFDAFGTPTPEPDSVPFVSARVISGYVRGQTVEVYILLYDACIDVSCENPDTTCDPATGQCVDAHVDPGDLPPRLEAGMRDAGVQRTCDDPSDCDDGQACTDELCIGGACAHEYIDSRCTDHECAVGNCARDGCFYQVVDNTRCNDRIACTDDVCTDAGCVSTPNNNNCTIDPGGVCVADVGCRYPDCTPSNCIADNTCRTAACIDDVCEQGDVCTTGPCCEGMCTDCVDTNPCTDDFCGAGDNLCHHVPYAAPTSCDHADWCVLSAVCVGTACTPTGTNACDDGEECTSNFCNEAIDMCQNSPLDGGPCTNSSGCVGFCVSGMCDGPSTCTPMDGGRPPCDGSEDCVHLNDPATCTIGVCMGPRGCGPINTCGVDCCGGACCMGGACCLTGPGPMCCPPGQICGAGGCMDAGTPDGGPDGGPPDGGPPPDGGSSCPPPQQCGPSLCCLPGDSCCADSGTFWCCPFGGCGGVPGLCTAIDPDAPPPPPP